MSNLPYVYELEDEVVDKGVHILYFKHFSDFMRLAKQLNVPVFKVVYREGFIRKKPVTYYFFYACENILCIIYQKEREK